MAGAGAVCRWQSDCPKCDMHQRGSEARIRIAVALVIGEVKIEYQVTMEPKGSAAATKAFLQQHQ